MAYIAPGRRYSLVNPIVVLAFLYVLSIIFFHFVEGWSYLDAVYFTTITITTVGYGDIAPVTDLGKIGAIALVFAGISLAFYVISHLGLLREKKVDPHIQKRLEVLRSITMLQSKKIKKGEIKEIKKKIQGVKFT
jgi:voltage-gated potassium channel